MNKKAREREVAKHIRGALKAMGYDLRDPDLKRTPERVAKTWVEEMVHIEPPKNVLAAFPKKGYKQMVVIHGHEVWTRCPHHLERVRMIVSIGYIPGKKDLIPGLSKPVRFADYMARGLMLQEEFAEKTANAFFETLEPQGVGVYVRGWHNCMQARGVRTRADATTTALRGNFLEDPSVKAEFIQMCLREISP